MMLDLNNFLGARPQDHLRARGSMLDQPANVREMMLRASDHIDALETRLGINPETNIPPISTASDRKDG